eukprot:3667741-Pleurochrysis_carterae.AAC.1
MCVATAPDPAFEPSLDSWGGWKACCGCGGGRANELGVSCCACKASLERAPTLETGAATDASEALDAADKQSSGPCAAGTRRSCMGIAESGHHNRSRKYVAEVVQAMHK